MPEHSPCPPVSSVVYGRSACGELSRTPVRIHLQEDAVKAYFQNLPMKTWLLLVIPAVVIAYPVARIVIPAVVHAVVPEVVRSVLRVI